MKYSIITVAYNNLAGLKLTAESVFVQTFRDFEWLVFDGGSSDGSREYLESLGAKVSYWESKPDGGIYDAMNKGIRKASGEYLIFMNSGDRFASADILMKVADSGCRGGVIYGDWNVVAEGKIHCGPRRADFNFFCEDNICHQSMFVRAELLKKSEYSTTIGVYSDWAKWLQFAADGVNFEYVPGVVCDYDGNGVSSHVDPILECSQIIAKLPEPLRIQIIARLLDRSISFAPLSKYLGIDNVKKLPWLLQKEYKLCNSICKRLKRAYRS